MTNNQAYNDLVERVRKINAVGDAAGVLRWDQEVMMPEGGTPARSRQLSALSSVQHDLLTDDRTGNLLDGAEDEELTGEQAAVVREVRRRYERATCVPNELVEEISQATSEALPVWKEAKNHAEFSTFKDTLEELVDLKKRYAEHIDPDRQRYEVLFEDFEPYLGLESAADTLDTLRSELVPFIDRIRDSDVDVPEVFTGQYGEDLQMALVRDALDALGYDWSHGRLDTAPHPFSSGTQYDARVTTRFGDDPLDALTSTIHEYGHASYTLGLPRDQYGTPLGEARDLSVHESQSRLWENHVGRSRAFWRYFLPTAKEHLGVDASVDEIYMAANEVREDNLVRVEADELTYHMHVVARFEIERRMIDGDLPVREVPEVWNDLHDDLLGIRPSDDAEGCLQDIHWSHASYGYFPTYTLGSVLAAQLYSAAENEIPDLETKVAEGSFTELLDWLRTNVHRHGKRYRTPELVREATSRDFTAEPFLNYVEEKFGGIYGV